MKLNKTWILVPLLIVLVVSLSGCVSDSSSDTVETTESEEVYDMWNGPPGDWMVVDGVLTNGTYNTTDLTNAWDHYRKVHVVASDFVFVYNDGISDKYHGDTGLKYAVFNDTLTGCCFHIDKNLARGVAYATKNKFNIKNFSFECWRSYGNEYNPPDDFYIIYDSTNITLDNGTVIESLRIDQDLTPDQKSYFDDYDTQLYRYYEDQKIKEMRNMEGYMADIESDIDYQNTKNDKEKNKGTFSGYTSRSGYIYGRYY